MSVQALQHAQWARREGGGVPKLIGGVNSIEKLIEATTQDFDRGQLVYLDSDGKVAEVADGNITAAFLGFAQADAIGTTDTALIRPVLAITEDDVWIVNCYHATAASALSARNMMDARWGLKIVSGKLHLDMELAEGSLETATAVNAWCRIVGFVDPLGDQYGRVYVKIGRRGTATDGAPQVDFLQSP